MTEIAFKKVDKERRSVQPRPGVSKYRDIWLALEAGDTLELIINAATASRLRSSWKARKTGRDLHVIADGKVYIAWLGDA